MTHVPHYLHAAITTLHLTDDRSFTVPIYVLLIVRDCSLHIVRVANTIHVT